MGAETGRTAERRVLILTAVEAEREAVVRGLERSVGASRREEAAGVVVGRFVVALAGVGPAMAAARTAVALAEGSRHGASGEGWSLVVSAGIGGGFAGQAGVGELVVADAIVAADLGAQTADGGFLSVDELGFGSGRADVDFALAGRLTDALREAGLAAGCGPILTVSTATGTADRAAELAARVPGAASESMEGYGVAVAARLYGLPCLELRAVSNAVGPRDRSAWRIGDALTALEAACSLLPEVLR